MTPPLNCRVAETRHGNCAPEKKKRMKGLTITIIVGAVVGAAVAGAIYYAKNSEQMQDALGKAKDKAGDFFSKINWRAAGKVAGTVAQQAL